tara:strand:- start:3014 stop:3253 length:240 start_codon:yes stop_codon:yes gene_type:complete
MSNNSFTGSEDSFNYQTTTFLALGLFIFSEVMPFIKKTKGAGVVHSLICLLRGSKCMIDKALEVVDIVEEKTEEIVDKV